MKNDKILYMKNEIYSLLSKLIAINSAFPNEKRLADFLDDFFTKKSYKVYKQPVEKNRYNLIIEKGSGNRSIAFLAHLDTVTASKKWTTDPYKTILKEDRIYGHGTFCMKGALVSSILVFLAFKPKNYKLKLILVVDEENISKGGFVFANSPFMKDIDCCLCSETSFDSGLNGIITGRIGRAVFVINIEQPPIHYFFYEPARDINLLAAEIISDLEKFYIPSKKGKQFVFTRRIESGVKDYSLTEKVLIEVDASVLPPNTNQMILDIIDHSAHRIAKKYHPNIKITVDFKKRETPFLSPYEIAQDNPYLMYLKESVLAVTKHRAQPYFRSTVSDENIFGTMGKTVLGIGPEGANAHAPDEWVSLSSLEKLYLIFINFLNKVDKN